MPLFLFWRMGRFCLQHLWIDGGRTAGKVLPRGQSGVPLMVWKEKRGRRGIVPFFFLLGRVLFLELSFWNNPRNRFFWFPVTLFIVHELFLWDSQAAPATIVLSQLDLFDISQTKWKILTVINSELLRGWGLDSEGDCNAGRAYFKELFCVFYLLCSGPVFLPERCILLPSGRCWECLWSSRGSFPLPCLPKMPSYTSDKHTI